MKPRTCFRFGSFELRPADHVLLERGTPVRLTPKAFATLAALVRRHGSVVTRDELIREVWPDTFVEEGGLTQNISVLRKLLNQPDAPELIETVPRRGYRFAALVEETHVEAANEVRIAVLPFDTDATAGGVSQTPDIGDGLLADVMDALTTTNRFRVAAFSTITRFRGTVDPVRAARDLRVEVIVTGRLRMREGSVLFDVELVDGTDGTRLWARRFDRAIDELQSIPRQIAADITAAAGTVPSPDGRTLDRHVRHPAAYTDYLEGRHHLSHRTTAAVGRAIEKFERALERDPEYAPAYAGLAEAHTLAASAEYGGGRWTESMARAKAAAVRALVLDPDLAQAHASLALVHFRLDWNWALAESEFRRAIALSPRNADVHHAFGFYLIAMERREEALAETSEAYRLQSLSPIVATGLGRVLLFAGDHARAIEQLEHVRDLEPSFAQAHFDLSFAYASQDRLREAIESCQKAITLAPERPVSTAVLANLLARAGREAEARSILDDLEQRVGAQKASPFDVALVHAGFGDVDRALDSLGAACRERHGLLVYLRVEPLWNPLRRNPRFDDLLRQVGLVQRF